MREQFNCPKCNQSLFFDPPMKMGGIVRCPNCGVPIVKAGVGPAGALPTNIQIPVAGMEKARLN